MRSFHIRLHIQLRFRLLGLLFLSICSSLIFVQNSHAVEPFSDAGQSTIDYSEGKINAAIRCKDLIAQSDFQFSVISADLIPNDGEVPAHCRVAGVIPNEVRFETNLPVAWNGRLFMYGNGGLAGTPANDPGKQISRNQALSHHFLTTYTDTGHDRRVHGGGTFAHNNLHKLVDYGFRAVHLTVNAAKSLAIAYYNQSVATSYWAGCSTGGRQGMINAQRFPEDFDGILAGAPAADYSGLKFSQAWRVSAISKSDLDEAEINELADHIYKRCDALDGEHDGLLSDPRTCDFDSQKHLPKCSGKDTTECFSKQELAALAQYYAPVILAGEEVYPAMPVGSEVTGLSNTGEGRTGWYPWLFNDNGPVLLDLLGSDFFRYMVFIKDQPSFDWTQFTFTEAPDNLAEFQAIVDAVDPDLSAFKARGGKLLSFFGWADPDINPLTAIAYRDQVQSLDEQVDDYYRLFMMPGMFHCGSGAGPDQFDPMTPLINWVEGGQAPESFDTWHRDPTLGRTMVRPTCAHPKRAHKVSDGYACR